MRPFESSREHEGAMLPTPLTPPYGGSADNIESDSSNGRMLTTESDTSYTNQPFSLATPTSNSSMILDDPSEGYTPESRLLSEDMLDESDQDMSDGGAPLTTIPSHAEEMDAEEITPEATEMTNQYNLVGLHHDSHIQSSASLNPFLDNSDAPSEPAGSSFPYEGHLPLPETINTTDLPAVMSEVSQQLQHIQDGQEHGNLVPGLVEHHDMFINHNQSTSPPGSFVETFLPPDPLLEHNVAFEVFSINPSFSFDDNEGSDADHDFDNGADNDEVDNQFNMNFDNFLEDWVASQSRRAIDQPRTRGPSQAAVISHRLAQNLEPMRRCYLKGEECDIQRIDWKDLGVTRFESRQRRRVTYKNYTNLIYPNRPQLHPRELHGQRLENVENYFKFRQMDFQHNVHIRHFQLRNLITSPSQNCVIYAAKTKAMYYDPTIESTPRVLMDLSNPRTQSFHSALNGCQISTLTSGHEIVVAGGFEGQYALINTRARRGTKQTEGMITEHPHDITNHAQVHLSRSSSPLVTFASNDSGIRTLDVTTNKFISDHLYDHAMNCTAVSPDQRLRVLVGDTRKVTICDSDTGQILKELDGHLDYGFACDWSENGWTVATGNQDMQVKIWDARKWGSPVKSIAAEMAGVRKLKFSPLGSGRPVLVAAEPADYVNIINAETWDSKHTLSFFGEIGGFDFTNDGQDLIVANCDALRGGIMEFERCDFATEGLCGKDELIRLKIDDEEKTLARTGRKRDYDTTGMADADDLMEESPDLRGTTKRRERRAALLTNLGLF